MQTAGQTLDERELSEAMKDTGLGTPATRAAIIEVLLKRGFIVRTGKNLEATEKGIHLIEVVHPEVKSPAMTGQWEALLKKIQQATPGWNRFSMASVNTSARSLRRWARQSLFRGQRRLPHPQIPVLPILPAQRRTRTSHPSSNFSKRRSASLISGPIRRPSVTRSRQAKMRFS